MDDINPPSVIETYERHGRTWATLRGQELVEDAWLERFCRTIPTGSAVLDIGCGSAVPISSNLVRRGYAVNGVDRSATMVELFRSNLPSIPVQRLDMREMALGTRFAGLIAWDSFFHLAPNDQRPMFVRFAAHAMPGVPLMFTSGTDEGHAIGSHDGVALYHGSLGPDEYRRLLDQAGFDLLRQVEDDPTCGNRTIWLARMRELGDGLGR
ncbi:class I SAM-dependent DNA methyltransferase [Sphingomonas bacterium]|uniref:class I SAM-dependent DNA methyltransferase n=1 Tax=Sphingomonas bacterium TaxID=1895847 RepID=UPI001577594E|nr:class I SAM-dependent methyltransferase [Sphingomonas bacterium]